MSKKIKIPKSVLGLRMSLKKFAKKNGIKITKKMKKREKKRNLKKLNSAYAEFAINGLNKAVKIMSENPEMKKIDKVKDGVDNIITNPIVMKRIAKVYKKDPSAYGNMMFLPYMIMNTILFYNSDNISEEEKKVGEQLDQESLITFCEKILKKEIKRYKKKGLDKVAAFQLATVIPTAKLFKNGNRMWFKRLILAMYDMAKEETVDVDMTVKSILALDKKKQISKKEFLNGFFSEFILQKNTNKNAKMSDAQKQLSEDLTERALVYMDNLKPSKLSDMLRKYIKRRKTAEQYKNDAKRIIKFTDHANSNSPYTTIKKVVTNLIADNAQNELYLS